MLLSYLKIMKQTEMLHYLKMSQFYQKVTKLQNNLFDNSSQKIHLHICLLTSEIIYIASSNRLLKPQESKTNIKVFTFCVYL